MLKKHDDEYCAHGIHNIELGFLVHIDTDSVANLSLTNCYMQYMVSLSTETVTRAARAVCEIRAINVGILRESCRREGRGIHSFPFSAVSLPPPDGAPLRTGTSVRWDSATTTPVEVFLLPAGRAGGTYRRALPVSSTAWCCRGRLWGSGRRASEKAR